MAEKERRVSQEGRHGGEVTEKLAHPLSDSSSSVGSVEPATEGQVQSQHHDAFHGTPDVDHDEIEGAVSGHALDVELAEVSLPMATGSSANAMTPRRTLTSFPGPWHLRAEARHDARQRQVQGFACLVGRLAQAHPRA